MITTVMNVIENVNVLRYVWGIDLVALCIGGKDDVVDGMESATVVPKTDEDLMRGDICVKCLPVLQLLI